MELQLLLLLNFVSVMLFWVFQKPGRNTETLFFINSVAIIFIAGVYSFSIFMLLAYLLNKYNNLYNNTKRTKLKKVTLGCIFFVFIIACFSLFNKSRSFVIYGDVEFLLSTIGSSYILFKSISYILDTMQRKVESTRFVDVANYILFFPTYLNGPMYRFDEFSRQMSRPKTIKYNRAVYKISIGLFKILLISKAFQTYSDYQGIDWIVSEQVRFLLSLVFYYIYLYANFSGFCDIAIGFGAMLGFKVPENFNNPFFATNIADFWRKWHITLSRVLLDSIFTPLKNTLNFLYTKNFHFEKMDKWFLLFIQSSCYLITFIISGFWHGSAQHFIVWGIWHGTGLSIRRIYRTIFDVEGSLQNKPVIYSKAYGLSCWFITFVFVTLGWALFKYPLDILQEIFL